MPHAMDLSAMDLQDELAAHCLVLLSRKNTCSSHVIDASSPASVLLQQQAHHRPTSLVAAKGSSEGSRSVLALSSFQSRGRKTADSTGDFSGSDRLSPSSASDSSVAHSDSEAMMSQVAAAAGKAEGGGEAEEEEEEGEGVGAVDLSKRSRTRTAVTAASVSRSRRRGAAGSSHPLTSSLPDHQHFALLTHKANDDLHRLKHPHLKQQQQQPPQQQAHVVQREAPAAGGADSGAGSLGDHSPFMIARIMADLHQFRQRDPTTRGLASDASDLASPVEEEREEGVVAGHQSLLPGSRRTALSPPPSSRSLAPRCLLPGDREGEAGRLLQADAAANPEAGMRALAATSPLSEISVRNASSLPGHAISRSKKAAKTLTTGGKRHHQRRKIQVAAGSADQHRLAIEGLSGLRAPAREGESRACGNGNGSSSGSSGSGRHACAFPGCDKVYGERVILLLPSADATRTGRPSWEESPDSSLPFFLPSSSLLFVCRRKVLALEESLSQPYR